MRLLDMRADGPRALAAAVPCGHVALLSASIRTVMTGSAAQARMARWQAHRHLQGHGQEANPAGDQVLPVGPLFCTCI
jgi:hypothetical protein